MSRSIICNAKSKRIRRLLVGCICFLMIIALLFFVFLAKLRPMIRPIAVARAKSIATRAINAAVDQVLAIEFISYDSMIVLEHDPENRVTALRTNASIINRLKAELTSEITDHVNKIDEATIGIPIGSIIGGELLSGVGPRIYIGLLPVGYAETDIINTFSSAGINQTLHQIILEVTVTIGIVMPAYTEYTTVSTSIILGESVLLGVVPENYTHVATDEDLWDKINNFLELG